ncbi:kinase-like domain-containing protein [Xylaria digitata]|nr:kinase-like domain-containing protein [Xylaria digitata]
MRQAAHWLRQLLKRYSSTLSKPTTNAYKALEQPLQVGKIVSGDSGQTYTIEEILKERRNPLICVYRASSQGKPYLLKNPVPYAFEDYKNWWSLLTPVPHVRPLDDSITSLKILVYPLLDGHLLDFAKKNLSPITRRNIIRDTLQGLAEMHDRGIFFIMLPDIKPDNIFIINYQENGEDEPVVTDMQIGDLEDAAYTRGGGIAGCLYGNQLWRSPESWAKGRQSAPSDIFSFALFLDSPGSWRHILRRQISFFGDGEGLQGLIQHLGYDNPFSSRLVELLGTFRDGDGIQPLSEWQYGDADFRDLVGKMTNLDPARRITAREALEHPWFSKEL